MATLDSIPGDQRAVLQLVLGRGRSYDQIASLLSIGTDSVRGRALSALDALGPQTGASDEHRRLICDYLLGQLPEAEVPAARELLASSPAARSWARVVSAEITPLAAQPLPEIPEAAAPAASGPTAGTDDPAPEGADGGGRPRSSRRGGFVLLGLVAAVVIAVVLVLVLHKGKAPPRAPAAAVSTSSTSTSSTATSTTGTGTTATSATGGAKPLGQINLRPPSGTGRAIAVAEILRDGSSRALVIVGQNLPANTKRDSYAVWLYNSATDATRLGFVSPGVTANGKLSATSPVPSDLGAFKDLIITTETTAKPTRPGPILLEGTIPKLS